MLEKLKNHKSTLIGIEELRKYAVCIPLMPGPDGYEVLFEVRSANVKSQPGDVCFPGGRMEPGETPDETAVRETMEELLVEEKQLRLIGLMDPYLSESGNLVYPYAAVLEDYQGSFGRAEVESVFFVPLSFFLKTEPEVYHTAIEVHPGEDFPFERIHGGKNYAWRKGKKKVIFYSYEGRVIWGMTARIMYSFADIYRKEVLEENL